MNHVVFLGGHWESIGESIGEAIGRPLGGHWEAVTSACSRTPDLSTLPFTHAEMAALIFMSFLHAERATLMHAAFYQGFSSTPES